MFSLPLTVIILLFPNRIIMSASAVNQTILLVAFVQRGLRILIRPLEFLCAERNEKEFALTNFNGAVRFQFNM